MSKPNDNYLTALRHGINALQLAYQLAQTGSRNSARRLSLEGMQHASVAALLLSRAEKEADEERTGDREKVKGEGEKVCTAPKG